MPALTRSRLSRENLNMADAFDRMRNDYDAAKQSRFRRALTGVRGGGSGADYHYRSEADYLRIMEWARSFDRNDVVLGQGVSRLVENVLQSGIALDTKTGNKALDVYLQEKFIAWADDPVACHSAGQLTFNGIVELAFRHMIIDGDMLLLLRDNETVEPVEGHRLRTPNRTKKNVVHGILMDNDRRPKEYWLTKKEMGLHESNVLTKDIMPVTARDADGNPLVLQVFDPKRFSQARGISAVAPVMDTIGQHGDIQFAKLVQQQAVSAFAIIHEFDIEAPGGQGEAKGEEEQVTRNDGGTTFLQGIGPGMEIFAQPGETLTGFSPNVPNAEFFQHALLVLTFVAVNLGLPVSVLLLDPSNTNFSGWRGAMDQARIGFRRQQRLLRDKVYRPVYLWKVRGWLETDAVLQALVATAGRKANVFGHTWGLPAWKYIEPNKDSMADANIIAKRLNSQRGVLRERGLDIDKVNQEIIEDNIALITSAMKAADKINKAKDSDVDWREIAMFDPKGRKPDMATRRVESLARAVTVGVPVTVSEGRKILGLDEEVPAGATLLGKETTST